MSLDGKIIMDNYGIIEEADLKGEKTDGVNVWRFSDHCLYPYCVVCHLQTLKNKLSIKYDHQTPWR